MHDIIVYSIFVIVIVVFLVGLLIVSKKMKLLHEAFPSRIKKTNLFRIDFSLEFFALSITEKIWVIAPFYFSLNTLDGLKKEKFFMLKFYHLFSLILIVLFVILIILL